MKFSLRSLLLSIAIIAVVLAALGTLYRQHLLRDSASADEWPDRLKSLLKVLSDSGSKPGFVDVRHSRQRRQYEFFWRMPASQPAISAHIDLFNLETVARGDMRTSRMERFFPEPWGLVPAGNTDWYAWPYNRDDDPIDLHFWYIMIHDKDANLLYFNCYHWGGIET